jgi:predicted NAD/FAD-binding protein
MAGAIWSAEPRAILIFPPGISAAFSRTTACSTRNARSGAPCVAAHEYVQALARRFRERVRLNAPVEWVRRLPDQVLVKARGDQPHSFDQVVMACHADQALRLLRDATPAERGILGAIPFQDNEAVLHTDEHLLPQRKLARASWNYNRFAGPGGQVTVTYTT